MTMEIADGYGVEWTHNDGVKRSTSFYPVVDHPDALGVLQFMRGEEVTGEVLLTKQGVVSVIAVLIHAVEALNKGESDGMATD